MNKWYTVCGIDKVRFNECNRITTSICTYSDLYSKYYKLYVNIYNLANGKGYINK